MARGLASDARWRWVWLVPALLLAVQGIATGQGTIVYTRLRTPNPDPDFPWDSQGLRLLSGFEPIYYYMDLNGDGVTDFTFVSGNASVGGFAIMGPTNNAVLSLRSLDTAFSIALPFGSVIGTDASPYEWTLHGSSAQGRPYGSVFTASTDFGSVGFFTGVEAAYAGLQFKLAGRTHYGWVRVGAPLAGLNGGWIYDFAYETRPGVPIRAGAKPVAVPLAPPVVARPGYLRLNWPSEVGKAYQVQAKARLDALMWTNLSFAIPATSTNTMVDLPMSGAAEFFRVVEAD